MNAYLLFNASYSGTFEDAISTLYNGDTPCKGVRFKASGSDTIPCDLTYKYTNYPVDISDYMECYPPVYISTITQLSCDGSASPTKTPTKFPTTEPTVDPTNIPTTNPTIDPTMDPTTDPTFDPTTDPTMIPTKYPTIDPTVDPTIDPTSDPTHDPTVDPTLDPTNAPTINPTIDPTMDPTIDPTVDPTIDPTIYPTIDPTTQPTFIPTQYPTKQPTVQPTQNPSLSPTYHPSLTPTKQPTRFPTTSRVLEAFLPANYRIGNLSIAEIEHLIYYTHDTLDDIMKIIEKGFLELSHIDYIYFWIQLQDIKGEQFDDIEYEELLADEFEIKDDAILKEKVYRSREQLTLETYFKCETVDICKLILDSYDKSRLEANARKDLRKYFDFVSSSNTDAAGDHDINMNSSITFAVLNTLSASKIQEIDPDPFTILFDFKHLQPTLIYNFVPFFSLSVIYIIFVVSKQNANYIRLFIWFAYCWLYGNCVYYYKYSGVIYAMNIVHVLYIYCKDQKKNYMKEYSKYGTNEGGALSETVKKLSKEILLSQTNVFIFFSIIGGIPASLQLVKCRFYRLPMFSLSIADQLWMKLFRDIGFIVLLFIYYLVLFSSAAKILIMKEDVNNWNMASIFFGSMIVLCHIIYLIYKFRYKHDDYSDNRAVFQINARFKKELNASEILKCKHERYEKKLTKIIASCLMNSTHIKYAVEVLDIETNKNDLIISTFVSWTYKDGRANDDIIDFGGKNMEMEIDFREQLITEIRFAPRIAIFCGFSANQKPPQISIKGKYSKDELHSYQTVKFETENDDKLQELKENIYDKIKPLYKMTNNDICNIIKYWFLSDIKYRSYNKEVMKIIRDKNINGIALQDLSTKKMNIKLYLTDLFGRYFEPIMIQMICKTLFPRNKKADHKEESLNLSTIDSYRLAEVICTLRMEQIDKRLREDSDLIDGSWFIHTADAQKLFINKLRKELAINNQDAVQIYQLLQTFNIPKGTDIESRIMNAIHNKLSEDININNIDQLSAMFPINVEDIALKLKNNLSLTQESEVIMNLFYHLIEQNKTDEKRINYGLLNKLYEIYASVFGQMCLNEWFCSECCYHNRSIKINSKLLKSDSSFMMCCIVCGTKKKAAIMNTLKGESKQKYLLSVETNENEFKCDRDGTIKKCTACQKIMTFLREFEEHQLDYLSILFKLDAAEVTKHILMPAIQQIHNEAEKDILLKTFNIKFFSDDVVALSHDIDGKTLSRLEEDEFQSMMIQQQHIDVTRVSVGTVKHLYDLMYLQCDKYVTKAREEIFGSTCSQLMHFWKHCLKKHMNSYNNNCAQNLFKCKMQTDAEILYEDDEAEQKYTEIKQECNNCTKLNKLDLCENARCVAIARNMDRFQLINSQMNETTNNKKSKARHSLYGELKIDVNKLKCNDHIKLQLQNDNYFQYELDSIHTHLLHNIHDMESLNLPIVKKPSRQRDSKKHSTIFAEPIIELEELKLPIVSPQLKAMVTEYVVNKSKYTTDIGLYGFGIDHRHQYLKPHASTKSMHDEMMECGFVTPNAWDVILNKAFNKKKQIIDHVHREYVAKQYSADYNINRGDPIGVHHLMAICFYTDFSYLCTDYRSTFRRVENKDKNDDDIRMRHSKYYFFSRFLYEAIEFFGCIMHNQKTVYHGLDQPFLFKDFLAHFNCPTSTTPDEQIARNFARENGIILALRNGNEETANIPQTIAQFMKEQPRYLDVSWISAFQNEREYLFYGNNIIFKIHNIIHREVPRYTLKLLTLLQRIIEGRNIDWVKEKKGNIRGLARKLTETCAMNMQILQDKQNDDDDNKDEFEQKSFKTKTHSQFMEFAVNALENKDIAAKYKWKETQERKAKLIEGFKEYCTQNKIDGLMFIELSRKIFLKYMETQYGIRKGETARMHNVLKKEIDFHDKQIIDTIDAIEKQKIEKYQKPYYLKLFHYFTVSRFDFICIPSLYNIPSEIQHALFIDNETNSLSLSRLTDMFYNANNIAFTELEYDEMIRNCSTFCKSVRDYANNVQNINKRLKYVVFKSVNVANSKYSTVLRKYVQKYQLQTSNLSIRYSFEYKMNHILYFDIHSIRVPSIEEAQSFNNTDEVIATLPSMDDFHQDTVIGRGSTGTMSIVSDYPMSDGDYFEPQPTPTPFQPVQHETKEEIEEEDK